MNSRERVLAALHHKEPDRVPFDLGGTNVTGIQAKAYTRLREYLKMPAIKVDVIDIRQQLARVDDDLMERLGVDVSGVSPRSPVDFVNQITETEDKAYSYFYDDYHVGWRMPNDGGLYFDMFDHPLSGAITEADIDSFDLPDPLDPLRFTAMRDEAKKVIEEEKRALVIANMSSGLFETYAWTRGFRDAYADWAASPAAARKLLRRFTDVQLVYWEKVFDIMQGIPIDVVQLADDMAGQTAMLISPRSYRVMMKPLHRELCDLIHSRSQARVFFHSCGAIRPLIPDLIEVGVDILNPVQVSAVGMDSAELKREFGRDLVFWGGGVDTQNAFDARFSPEKVREDVRRRLRDLMPGGGFVFNPVHNIQGNVPPENIMAMWEAVQEFGAYS